MIMQITRRNALLGASAAVAVAAVPTAVEGEPTGSEVEFFHMKMTEALEEEMYLDEACGVALKAFREVHPRPGVHVERLRPSERVWCETESDIERVFGDNRGTMECDPEYWSEEYRQLYRAADKDPMNRELFEKYRRATREHDRRVTADVLRQFTAAKAELEPLQEKDAILQEAAGIGELRRRIDAANDRYFKFQRLFLESQAETPRSLLLRVQEMDDDVEEGTYGREIYDALLRDLGRLGGGLQS